MNTNQIFLRRKREIGEVLSDGFSFIRQNFKLIGKILMRFVGPFFLLQVFMNSFYSYAASDVLSGLSNDNGNAFNTGFGLGSLMAGMTLFSIIGLVLTSILFYTMLNGTVFGVFESYLKNEGIIKIDDVSKSLKKNWPRYLGATFIIMIVGGLGTGVITLPLAGLGSALSSAALVLLFVFVGILLAVIFIAVPLSLVFPVMIFDQKNVFQAIGDAYAYLKGNFFLTFLTFFVVYMISIVITSIFQMPMVVYMLVQQMSGTVSNFNAAQSNDWIMIALTTLSQFFQYTISALIPIFTAFIYFNLHERKYKTGVYQEIDSIGNSTEKQVYQ